MRHENENSGTSARATTARWCREPTTAAFAMARIGIEQAVARQAPTGGTFACRWWLKKLCSVERRQPPDTYCLRRRRRETPVTTRYDNSTAAGGPNAVAKSAIY